MPTLESDPAIVLEQHRAYLQLLARLYLDRHLQAKVGVSDVVQQTFLEAQKSFERFRGNTGPELAAWLRKILACQVARCVRDLHRDKRDVDREQSLQAALDRSSQRLEAFLAADDSSPSQRAQRNEWSIRVAAALETIGEDQREAIILHYYQGLTVGAVAQRLKKSPAAVAGLLQRGLRSLRGLLAEKE
jgi:RNA polymerase sigma-70 factor (ECF subfamily)